ncbi:MAG: pilus assembly protein [Armatimonadetes bacterium]|nr:pilus assembly protein [Armatimonadota bacterium]MDW8121466.1 TadE/TadG family type IV pilus assembly protein [Armatimonadota bacterium]
MRGSRRGQTTVEFGLSVALFVLLLLGLVEAGRYVFVLGSLTNAAREGARYAVVQTGAPVSEIVNRVRQATAGVDRNQVQVTAPAPPRLSGTYVTVTVSYPYRSILGWVFNRTITVTSEMRVP